MGLKTDLLIESVNRLLAGMGYGGLSEVARAAGLTAAGVRRVAGGEVVPRLDTWEKLHLAFPDQIPPPTFDDSYPVLLADGSLAANGGSHAVGMGSNSGLPKSAMRRVVVFDANCGNGIMWTDGGCPVGHSLDYEELPAAWLDENSFVVRVHNDSMLPTLEEGDKVLIKPSAPLSEGKLVFARWPEDGEVVVKRYRRYGGAIVLESDNKAYDPIVLDEKSGRDITILRVTKIIKDV